MPARVEYRLGSIFDEGCGAIVIPCSTGGTVTPGVAADLRKADIPFPGANRWGSILLSSQSHPRYGLVVYAGSVQGTRSSPEIVEGLGRKLGELFQSGRKIAAPLLGAGSGDVPHALAAAALERGFLSSAPDGALLVISIRDPEVLATVQGRSSPMPPAASPMSGHGDEVTELTRKEVREAPRQPAPEQPKPTGPEGGEGGRGSLPADDPAQAPRHERTRVFVSYSHEDAEWLTRLQKHLAPLEREGADVWDDTRIKAGAQWRAEIREALARTKVAILLISADFLASPFIVTDELPPLLKAAEEDGATILPVIISPCRFERMESLSRFQAVNDPRKPLVKLRRGNREEVLDEVARAVEDALKR